MLYLRKHTVSFPAHWKHYLLECSLARFARNATVHKRSCIDARDAHQSDKALFLAVLHSQLKQAGGGAKIAQRVSDWIVQFQTSWGSKLEPALKRYIYYALLVLCSLRQRICLGVSLSDMQKLQCLSKLHSGKDGESHYCVIIT